MTPSPGRIVWLALRGLLWACWWAYHTLDDWRHPPPPPSDPDDD